MKFYLKENVLEAALRRIRWLFDEFEHIVVDFSGGKYSTVVMNLALQVAEEKNRLPLSVMFLDQEAEWQSVIDYVRRAMKDPRIDSMWHQCPLRISNGTSKEDPWLYCWKDGDEWMREKEPDTIHENPYGTLTLGDIFGGHLKYHWPTEPAIRLAGVRCDESPARYNGLTAYETYKGETWGKVRNKKIGHYDMYPLYDWSTSDIWKAIHSYGWPYCSIYDSMYQYGVPLLHMRVSNLHHETAIHSLHYLQEIESETWERLTQRLKGINTAKHLEGTINKLPPLPPMFKDWQEYRDFLLDKLITDSKQIEYFKRKFAYQDDTYYPEIHEQLWKMHVSSLLVNDYHGVKMSSFSASHGRYSKNKGSKGGYVGAATS